MNQRILIVGAGGNQVGIIRKARQLGLCTVAMDGDPDALGLPEADASVVANIRDAGVIGRAAREHRVDGIYAAAELAVEAVADAAWELGLPGVPPEVAVRVRNKLAMREALALRGGFNPAFRGVHTPEDAEVAARELGLPVIVKPADANASKGVTRVDSSGGVVAAFERARERTYGSDTVLIEAFMDGEEFNVDGLVYEGKYILGGMTAKERSAPPNRFDLGIFMPPLEPLKVLQPVQDTVAAALDTIGFRNGTTHVEVIVTPDGPRIVEMAGRPGGGRIPTDLIPLTYGMDLVSDSLRIALGQPPREQRTCERGAAVYWIPAEPGVVRAIEGVDEALAVAGVREIVLAVKPGDTVEPVIDCVTRDRLGYVLADGDTVQAAIAAAKRARDLCRIVTQ
jgi:biotin carboxylase